VSLISIRSAPGDVTKNNSAADSLAIISRAIFKTLSNEMPWNGIESHEARRQFADPVAGVFPVVCIHVQPFSAAIIHFQCIHRKRGLL
jgi:hypothetical protein